MKVVVVIALFFVVAGCKHETPMPTMMMRCYNCDTPTIIEPELNRELKPAKKPLQPWQDPSQTYLALG